MTATVALSLPEVWVRWGQGSSTPVQQPHQAAAERAFCPATGSWTWPRGFPRPGPLATSCGLPATSAPLCSGSWTNAAQPSRSPCRGRGCPSSLSPRHCREAGPLLTYSAGVTGPPPRTHTPRPQPLTVSCHAPSHQRQPESKWASPPAHGPWPLGHGPGQGHGACPETGSPRHPSIRGQVPFFPTPTLPTDGLPTGAPRSANKGQRPVVAPAWEAPSPHGKWTAHVLQPPAPLYPPGTWPLR